MTVAPDPGKAIIVGEQQMAMTARRDTVVDDQLADHILRRFLAIADDFANEAPAAARHNALTRPLPARLMPDLAA
jgi:hypothetical protein